MVTSNELFGQMKQLSDSFESEHNGTTKEAKSRARKHNENN